LGLLFIYTCVLQLKLTSQAFHTTESEYTKFCDSKISRRARRSRSVYSVLCDVDEGTLKYLQ